MLSRMTSGGLLPPGGSRPSSGSRVSGRSLAPGNRRADIQGLRAVAVAAVIAHHLFAWPQAGFLGVDAFFVVSGFVITAVLLRERDRSGRTSLVAFWARRARRILPLALLVLAVTVAAARWAYAPAKAAGVQTDAAWAAVFAGNWHFAQAGTDYFQLGQAPSPVLHFWSLGVEEQFYLVWPWVFALAVALGSTVGARSRGRARGGARGGARHTARGRGRVAVALVAALAGAGSIAWAARQTPSDATTAYFSSLTRAWEIAAGAALAALTVYAVRMPAAVRAALSWGGLAGLLAAFALVRPGTGVPYPAAIAAVAATLAILLAGVGQPVPGQVLLTNPVSRYLGDISYGLYLWHFPLVVFVAFLVSPATPLGWATVLAGTLALAAIGYHLVERPVLDAPQLGREQKQPTQRPWQAWWLARRRGIVASSTALACILAAMTGAAAADPRVFEPDAALAAAADNGAVPAPDPTSIPADLPPPSTSSSPTTSATPEPLVIPLGATGRGVQDGLRRALASGSWPSDLSPPVDQWQTTKNPATEPCTATVASDPDSCTFGNREGPMIIVYGDSLGIPLLATVVAAYGRHYTIRGMTKLACAVNGVDADFGQDDWAVPCVKHRRMTIAYLKKVKPAALIMVENYAWSLKLKSGARGKAAGREWLRADQAFVDAVKGSVGHVVVLGPSLPGVGFLDCYRPGGSPGRCVTGIPSWWKTTRDAERRVRDATFVDTLHWYCVDGRCPLFTRTTDTVLKADYLHMTVQYARQLAPDLVYRLRYAGVLVPDP